MKTQGAGGTRFKTQVEVPGDSKSIFEALMSGAIDLAPQDTQSAIQFVNDNCGFLDLVQETFYAQQYAFAVRRGDVLKSLLDRAVTSVWEKRLLDRWTDDGTLPGLRPDCTGTRLRISSHAWIRFDRCTFS